MATLIPSKLEQRAVDIHNRAKGAVAPLGVATVPDQAVRFATGDSEWVVVPAEQDPHLARGTFAMPKPVLDRLGELDKSKVTFDRLFIAHELPTGSLAKIKTGTLDAATLTALIPDAAPDPKTVSTLKSCTKIARIAAGAPLLPVAVAVSLPAAGVAAVGVAAALDPALFGVVTASCRAHPGELGAWFLIAAWT